MLSEDFLLWYMVVVSFLLSFMDVGGVSIDLSGFGIDFRSTWEDWIHRVFINVGGISSVQIMDVVGRVREV